MGYKVRALRALRDFFALISHYGCYYVVHGDDITSDSSGEDCYRYVKAAGRFKVVKRTPGISTTDLVGRMLLCTRNHFIKSLQEVLAGKEGPGTKEERQQQGEEMAQRIEAYATDESGHRLGPSVWGWNASKSAKEGDAEVEAGVFSTLVEGKPPCLANELSTLMAASTSFHLGILSFSVKLLKPRRLSPAKMPGTVVTREQQGRKTQVRTTVQYSSWPAYMMMRSSTIGRE